MEFQIGSYEMRDEIGEIDFPSSPFQFSPLSCVLDIHTGINWIISVSEHLEAVWSIRRMAGDETRASQKSYVVSWNKKILQIACAYI